VGLSVTASGRLDTGRPREDMTQSRDGKGVCGVGGCEQREESGQEVGLGFRMLAARVAPKVAAVVPPQLRTGSGLSTQARVTRILRAIGLLFKFQRKGTEER